MTDYTNKLKDLVKTRENITSEIDSIIDRMEEEGTLTFEVWLDYANKTDYTCLLSKSEAPLIRDIVSNAERESVVFLEDILDYYLENILTKEEEQEYEEIKKELMKLNYGSMVIDW